MKRKTYIQPHVVAVTFVTEEGYTATVTRIADETILINFHSDNATQYGFRNDHFNDLGANDNGEYNFFGD